MIMKRRSLLKSCSVAVLAMSHSGWFYVRQALAVERPKDAFAESELDAAIRGLFGSEPITETDEIKLGIAELAENGAVVPVKVNTTLTGVESITLFGEKNPVPLIAQFHFHADNPGFVATRIKMAESSNVIAVVRAKGKLYSGKKFVEVTVGGCG
jgi:sulfur-oxidizing protein SoxY